MMRLIAGRVVGGLFVVFFVATFAFFMIRLAPGGPFDDERRLQPHIQRNIERQYHLDWPLSKQYTHYMANLALGDLGHSMKRNSTVGEIIGKTFPVSALLGVLALGFACVFGLVFGVIAAARQNSWVDHASMTFALLGISMPAFVLGPILIGVFSLELGWLPPALWRGPASMILPAATLGMIYMGVIARLSRSSMLETLRQDYIRTARAKGLDERTVVWKHAIRLGLLPVVTYLGPATAALITGSFVVEQVFQIPGLGYYFIASISDRDYPMLTGVLVFYSIFLVILNLLVDVTYGFLDPRIREGK